MILIDTILIISYNIGATYREPERHQFRRSDFAKNDRLSLTHTKPETITIKIITIDIIIKCGAAAACENIPDNIILLA